MLTHNCLLTVILVHVLVDISKAQQLSILHIYIMQVSQRARPSPERLEARIWSLEKKQETVIDLVQDMKNQNSDLKQAVKDLKDEYGDLIRQVKVSKLPPFLRETILL